MSLYNADVSRERAALMRSQRRKIDVQTRRILTELVPKAQMSEVWNRIAGNVKARMLSIPPKMGGRLIGQHDPGVITDQLDAEIREALAELSSEGNIERFMAELEELPIGDTADVQDDDAAAPANGKRVVRRKPKAKPGSIRRARPVEDKPR